MALLKINNASNLPTVTFGNSSKAVVGDAVVAIGNALGLAAGTPTVTQGIVSALGRSVTAGGEGTQTETLQNLIQTDAAINPGNSGGPLIDTSGQVIGMNTAVAGTSSDGTIVAEHRLRHPHRPGRVAAARAREGRPGRATAGGYLGVDITTLTPALRQQYGFTPTSGAVILSVVSGSPAAKAGLVQGDVIVDIDGTADHLGRGPAEGDPERQAGTDGDASPTTSGTASAPPRPRWAARQEAQQQQSGSGSTTNPFGGGGFPGFGNSGSTGGTPAELRPRPAAVARRDVEVPVRMGRREVHRPPLRLPPARLDVLEHVGHVVGVLLVGELAVAGVDRGASSRTGGRASRRACVRGMIWVHFTTTSLPSIAVNSTGNFQSSMPSMESTSQRAMASRPSRRPQAPSM